MGKKELNKKNLLDLTPIHAVDWVRNEDGTISLWQPKTRNRLLKLLIKRLGKGLYYNVKLDRFGSFVWERCNGRLKIEEIALSLKQEFGEDVDPVYERLGMFFHILNHYKLIRYIETH